MDKSNLNDILNLAGAVLVTDRTKLITHFSEKYKDQEVPDPYYDTENGFQLVFNMLDDSVEGIIKHYT